MVVAKAVDELAVVHGGEGMVAVGDGLLIDLVLARRVGDL